MIFIYLYKLTFTYNVKSGSVTLKFHNDLKQWFRTDIKLVQVSITIKNLQSKNLYALNFVCHTKYFNWKTN